MKDLFKIPEDFAALSRDELLAWIESATALSRKIADSPSEFTADGELTMRELIEQATAGVAAIEAAKVALAALSAEEPEGEGDGDGDAEGEGDGDAEVDGEAAAAELAELAGRAEAAAAEAAAEPETEVEAVVEVVETEAVVAAAAPPAIRRGRPARSRAAVPAPTPDHQAVALTASAEGLGFGLGTRLGETPAQAEHALASMMIKRRGQFGDIAEGTHGEKVPIAQADWTELYPGERRLTESDLATNWDRVNTVTASAVIEAAFARRIAEEGIESLTASGGLCAPVTPYYGLQLLAVADRPVRAALPSFQADRGGINAARPAGLGSISGGVGIKTVAEDAAGGTTALKTCQVVDCPPFTETDVEIIYHCLQFGNLGARVFPELLAQWNSLVMAAHARVAETALLDGIDTASTQVTASALGLGASATLPSQIIAAANGMRSRNRMDTNAVLRVILPFWVLDLLVSDVYRSQFGRFDMSPAQFVALLRSHNVEPSFHMDGATGKGQVFAAQTAAGLLPFPANIVWYLFPEGSFLYLDGGTLELGLVRDSVLNSTNDFQIFGETFEAVAFIGIESIAVTTAVCDSGTVSLPHATACPITY